MMVSVEIVYSPEKEKPVVFKRVQLKAGATVKDALDAAAWYDNYPETRSFKIGIFSRVVTEKTVLTSGDRIEIYRPLFINPKEARVKRAAGRSP